MVLIDTDQGLLVNRSQDHQASNCLGVKTCWTIEIFC